MGILTPAFTIEIPKQIVSKFAVINQVDERNVYSNFVENLCTGAQWANGWNKAFLWLFLGST